MAATVSVGCKLPHGLMLQLYSAPKDNKPAKALGKPVRIAGANQNYTETGLIVPKGAFGLTDGVDKAFMDKWMHDNRDMEAVTQGLIFVHDKDVSVRAEGKARKEQMTGFEGKDPKKLPADLTEADKK